MNKISYPIQSTVKKASYKKLKNTANNGTALLEIKQQIDELETKSKKNDISSDDIANQVFNLQQVVTNQQNQIGANASNITNLNTTKQNTLTFDASPTLNSTNPATSGGIFSALSEKQDVLTAGANISISSQNVISANVDTTNLQNQITNLSTNKQDKLTAGTNITIDQNNQISASVNTSALQPKLTAGANINIDDTNTISASFDTTNLQNQISNNYNAINNLQQTKQGVLTFDLTPTQNSNHVVTSGGVYSAIQNVVAGSVTMDDAPTQNSQNAIKSGGVYTALAGKQNTLTFDNVPTQNSTNPVTSGGVYSAIQNAGGGLSEVTASNVDSEQATSGQVLTADGNGGASWQTVSASGGASCNCATDIANLQNDIADINAKLLVMQTKIKSNEVEYNETIYNEYDVYERELDLSGNRFVYSPSVLFSTEATLTSTDENDETISYQVPLTVQISITVNVSEAGTYQFYIYDSGTIIKQTDIQFANEDVNEDKVITLKSSCFVANAGHNYYVYVTSNNAYSTATVSIFKLKMEIIAPNVTIHNKIHPFDVQYCYYTNKYYLSDCTSGFAKLAEINANDLHSTADIVWTQTNIPAQSYKTYFIGKTDNTSSEIGKRYAIITNKNDTVSIFDCDENVTIYTAPRGTHKISQVFTKHNYSILFKSANYTTTFSPLYFYIEQAGNMTTNNSFTNANTVANIEAIRNNLNYLSNTASWGGNVVIRTDGTLAYHNRGTFSKAINLSHVQDAKIYMKRVSSSNQFFHDFFVKQFGKYYHYNTNYLGTNFTCDTTQGTEVMECDDLFYGANNDYFVVINNALEYVSNQNN